jgi:hypothetical protein
MSEREELGRFYGEQHFAIAWTAANSGARAKKVTAKGWPTTKRLADGDFAAGLFKERAEKRNPAIVLRPSGIVGIEADGAKELAWVESLKLRPTITVRSSEPTRQHRWYLPPGSLERVPYVAFRFENGKVKADTERYLLCPPAIHPSGAVYSFLDGLGPGQIDIAELSEEDYRTLCAQAATLSNGRPAPPVDEEIPEGLRRHTLTSLGASLHRRGLPLSAIRASLRATNTELCKPPLPADEVDAIVAWLSGKQGGPPLLGGEASVDGKGPLLAEVEVVVRHHLDLPDPAPLHVVLAAVIANRMEKGEPVWLVILGGSSRGKTELLMPLDGLEGVRVTGALTPASLLSGTPPNETAKGATGGILRELGTQGLLVVKDFGAILSLPHETRSQVLQALRDLYDGRYTRDVGAGGGKKLEWSGRLGLLAGATSALDQAHAVLSALGERWLTLRLAPGGEEEQARLALRASDTATMRVELHEAVASFLSHVGVPELRPVSPEEGDLIAALAILACFARSPVERDPRTRELLLVHQPEGPARMTRQLHKLLVCLEAIGADASAVVERIAFDSIPSPRREVLQYMLDSEDASTLTSTVATALDLPTSSAERALEELNAHRLLLRSKSGEAPTSPNLWHTSEKARALWARIRELRGDSA